jgi:hypothetical protein
MAITSKLGNIFLEFLIGNEKDCTWKMVKALLERWLMHHNEYLAPYYVYLGHNTLRKYRYFE